jgi:hypothetical protein
VRSRLNTTASSPASASSPAIDVTVIVVIDALALFLPRHLARHLLCKAWPSLHELLLRQVQCARVEVEFSQRSISRPGRPKTRFWRSAAGTADPIILCSSMNIAIIAKSFVLGAAMSAENGFSSVEGYRLFRARP